MSRATDTLVAPGILANTRSVADFGARIVDLDAVVASNADELDD